MGHTHGDDSSSSPRVRFCRARTSKKLTDAWAPFFPPPGLSSAAPAAADLSLKRNTQGVLLSGLFFLLLLSTKNTKTSQLLHMFAFIIQVNMADSEEGGWRGGGGGGKHDCCYERERAKSKVRRKQFGRNHFDIPLHPSPSLPPSLPVCSSPTPPQLRGEGSPVQAASNRRVSAHQSACSAQSSVQSSSVSAVGAAGAGETATAAPSIFPGMRLLAPLSIPSRCRSYIHALMVRYLSCTCLFFFAILCFAMLDSRGLISKGGVCLSLIHI